MSISTVGAQTSGYASQMLTSLLSRLDAASTADASSTNGAQMPRPPVPPNDASGVGNAITGTGKVSLSGQVLMALMHMQNDGMQSADGAQGDPVQNLFSAIDSDSDDSVSQSEMERYIQGAGGTIDEADKFYSQLSGATNADGTSSSGISEDQMASVLPPPPLGARPDHGYQRNYARGTDSAIALVEALDSNSDGNVSEDEFDEFVTANGGTNDEAEGAFSALDTSKSGSLNSSVFADAWENLRNGSSASHLLMNSFLTALADANTGASTTSVTA